MKDLKFPDGMNSEQIYPSTSEVEISLCAFEKDDVTVGFETMTYKSSPAWDWFMCKAQEEDDVRVSAFPHEQVFPHEVLVPE